MARKYLQFQGDRVFYSNAQGDPDGNWQEWQDPTGKIKGIFNVAQYFKDNPILQDSNFPPSSANNLVGKTLFSSSEFTQYFIGQPIGVPVVTPTPTPIIISDQAQIILNKFNNGDYLIPNGVNAGIELVKNGSVTSELFVSTFNNLLSTGLITDKTIIVTPPVVTPPVIEKTWCIDVYQINQFGGVYSTHYEDVKREALLIWEASTLVKECGSPIPSDQEVQDFYNFVDTTIDENMVSQSIGAFTLKDGKVTGKIIYIAESSFNSYYYNKPVTSIVQIKDQAGSTIKLKTNNLNFTETQRDETITINEGVGDVNAVKIEFLVWKSLTEPIPFTLKKDDEIVAQEIGLKPCPIGQHRNFNNKCL